MKPKQKIYVTGGTVTPFIGKYHPDFIWKGHPDYGKLQNPTLEEIICKVGIEAMEDVGVRGVDIDCGIIGNFVGELASKQGHLGAIVAGIDPGLAYKPFYRVEAACASGGLAILAGINAINSGADLVMVLGAEVQTNVTAKENSEFLARAAHFATERSIDAFTFPCLFARRAKAYFDRFGGDLSDLAPIVVKAYDNASRNPKAHMHTYNMSLEHASSPSENNVHFLENKQYSSYLKMSDCSQISDGGCCLILSSERGLSRISAQHNKLVEIISYGHTSGPLGQVKDFTELDVTTVAANQAYTSSGWQPKDIHIAEVHDCFSITEALIYEALGFCKKGEGVSFCVSGATLHGGSVPVNAGGGLLACGHPVGATGVRQALEIFRQMNGFCGEYQITPHPTRGIAVNIGGDDRTSIVTLYRKK